MQKVSAERNRILRETAAELKQLYETGGDTTLIQRFQIRSAAAEKMKGHPFDLAAWLPWLSALLGVLPIVLTHLAPTATWAAGVLVLIPVLKDALSKA